MQPARRYWQGQSTISAAKNGNVSAAGYARRPGASPLVAAAFARYEAEMRARNAVDFDDLLLLSTALLQRDPAARAKYQASWSHLLVDEFQAPAASSHQAQAQALNPGLNPGPETRH